MLCGAKAHMVVQDDGSMPANATSAIQAVSAAAATPPARAARMTGELWP